MSRSDRRTTAQRLSIGVSDSYSILSSIPPYIYLRISCERSCCVPDVSSLSKAATFRNETIRKRAVEAVSLKLERRFRRGLLCRNVFQDCLLDHMEISIVEAEKRANRALNLREFYTVYLIETKWVKERRQSYDRIHFEPIELISSSFRGYYRQIVCHVWFLFFYRVTDPDFKTALTRISSLWRRYTEFELLRAYLEISYPYIVLPPLPEKKVLYAWQKVTTDTFDPDFVDRRRAGLEVRVPNRHMIDMPCDKYIRRVMKNISAHRISL